MTGLVFRLVILFAIVAGVTFAITRQLRGRKERARLESLESDIRALKADQELGLLDDNERAHVLAEVEAEVEHLSGRSISSETADVSQTKGRNP